MRGWVGWAVFLLVWALPAVARAATIHVAPGDDWTKIEAAQPGDEVVIAPGTYEFLVYLTQKALANAPIVIRAEDPKNPPVWDLSGTPLDVASGSHTGGDRGRGCWQLSGATNITIESIVFTHCSNAAENAAGIHYDNDSVGIVIRDCVFRANDNGLTGGTGNSVATVEFSEFDGNGNVNASSPTHNIDISGGALTLRYSYVHDPVQGQNLHCRAADAEIESNWFAHAASYEADLMTDDDFTGAGPYSQLMVFRGNVIVEGAPANHAQIIAVYNDSGVPNLTMDVEVINNTVIAAAPESALVYLSNVDHTKMSAAIRNNILVTSTTAYVVEDPLDGAIYGRNNWFQTGTSDAPLTASIFGSDPMFGASYRLAPGSPCIGAAAFFKSLPVTEYYLDDQTTRMYRVRSSAKDLGAFESTTTGPGIGPYTQSPVDGGVTAQEAGLTPHGEVQDEAGPGTGPQDGGGCGCDLVGSAGAGYGLGAALLGLLLACRRRTRRVS
jgi:hypothetical protein